MACRADGWTVEISQSESGRGLIGKEKERESGCGVRSSEPVGYLFGNMDTTVGLLMSPTFFVRCVWVCKVEFLASLRGGLRLLIFLSLETSRAGCPRWRL